MKVLFKFFNFILILIFLLLIGSFVVSYLQIFNSVPGKNNVKVSIPQGSSSSDIAEVLSEKGLIKSAPIFRLLVKYTGSGDKLLAGDYTFHSGMSMTEIVNKLKEGGDVNSVSFTVPEGYTVKQIAKLLDNKGIVDKTTFLNLVKKGVPQGFKFKYAGLVKKHGLEGFLFPDTYQIEKDAPPEEIIIVMLKRFQEVVPENFEKIAVKKGISPYEAIILASLIEREAQKDDERPLVSSVYYNRIKKDMHLECDATIQYLFDEPKEFLTYDDLEINSPYNTYLYGGLPPGPIANPGLPSIKAALNPVSSDYIYYVLKGDGRHKFSRTFEEHQKAVDEYQKNLEKQGK